MAEFKQAFLLLTFSSLPLSSAAAAQQTTAFALNTPVVAGNRFSSPGTGGPQLLQQVYGDAASRLPRRTAQYRVGPQLRSRHSVRRKVGLAMMAEMEPQKVGVVGVTGAVGQEIIGVLAKRGFPVSELRLFASARSAGSKMETPFGEKTIEEFTVEKSRECDVVFLAVSGDFAEEYAPQIAEEGGPLVIDNSSAFRYKEDIPLVVPEVNAGAAEGGKKRLIANPNCTTAIAVMALFPLHKMFGIKRCIMSTYQAASGAGAAGMNELKDGVEDFAAGKEPSSSVFAHPLPFNVIPHIDKFQENQYTKEEMKVTWECRKIMDIPDLKLSCTAVRIPTMRAHAEAITVEFESPVTPEAARELLEAAPGVKVVDTPSENMYPMPLTATGEYDVEVGRIRQSEVFGENGLDLFVVGDQLLRGAALNAVLIAEAV